MYTYFRVIGETVSLSYVTQLVLSVCQFLCPMSHNLSCQCVSFPVLCHTTCPVSVLVSLSYTTCPVSVSVSLSYVTQLVLSVCQFPCPISHNLSCQCVSFSVLYHTTCPVSVSVSCLYHTTCPVSVSVSLSYVTQLVLSVCQFPCPISHNLFCHCVSFSVLRYITCSDLSSGQSVSPYCDIPGMNQCLPEYNGIAVCNIVKYRSALDAKIQV